MLIRGITIYLLLFHLNMFQRSFDFIQIVLLMLIWRWTYIWRKQVKCCSAYVYLCIFVWSIHVSTIVRYLSQMFMRLFYGDNTHTRFKINRKHWLIFHVNTREDTSNRQKRRNTNNHEIAIPKKYLCSVRNQNWALAIFRKHWSNASKHLA